MECINGYTVIFNEELILSVFIKNKKWDVIVKCDYHFHKKPSKHVEKCHVGHLHVSHKYVSNILNSIWLWISNIHHSKCQVIIIERPLLIWNNDTFMWMKNTFHDNRRIFWITFQIINSYVNPRKFLTTIFDVWHLSIVP